MSSFRFLVQQLFNVRSISHKSVFSYSIVKSSYCKNGNIKKLHTSVCKMGYEASGKTTGFIVNKNMSEGCCVDEVASEGFVMANGDELVGPVILFPHLIFSWHVYDVQDISEESLSMFKIIEPRVDLLILGYGARGEYTPEVHKNFAQICKSLGIRFEALPTEQASGLFNFLSIEHRYVAAALIPPKVIDVLKLDKTKKYHIEDDEDEEVQLLPDGKDKKMLS